jgi:hypothetical protein
MTIPNAWQRLGDSRYGRGIASRNSGYNEEAFDVSNLKRLPATEKAIECHITVAEMLIDSFVPRYDFRESHQIVILASAQVVRRALEEWQPQESFLWRVLLRVRGLRRPRGTLREWAENGGLIRLADTEDEIVYGQVGRFWNAGERQPFVSPRSADEFRSFDRPNYAIAAMNVRLESLGTHITGLSTETRILATGARARWLFRFYWLLIRPFSGFLRQSMLRGIRKRALAPE